MARAITDMETWLLDNDDRIFRYLVYKKLFTPYEQEKKYSDESQFEDTHFRFAFIEEAVKIGPGEWLIGFREIIDGEICDNVDYHKLSDIQLSFYDSDQNMFMEEE